MNKVETSGDSSTSKIDKLIHELIYNPDDSEKTILNETTEKLEELLSKISLQKSELNSIFTFIIGKYLQIPKYLKFLQLIIEF